MPAQRTPEPVRNPRRIAANGHTRRRIGATAWPGRPHTQTHRRHRRAMPARHTANTRFTPVGILQCRLSEDARHRHLEASDLVECVFAHNSRPERRRHVPHACTRLALRHRRMPCLGFLGHVLAVPPVELCHLEPVHHDDAHAGLGCTVPAHHRHPQSQCVQRDR